LRGRARFGFAAFAAARLSTCALSWSMRFASARISAVVGMPDWCSTFSTRSWNRCSSSFHVPVALSRVAAMRSPTVACALASASPSRCPAPLLPYSMNSLPSRISFSKAFGPSFCARASAPMPASQIWCTASGVVASAARAFGLARPFALPFSFPVLRIAMTRLLLQGPAPGRVPAILA